MHWLEALSYIVTILGLPTAIFVFAWEQRKAQADRTDELHRQLSAEYDDFIRLALDHADLSLFRQEKHEADLTPEQRERRDLMFRMLISLFEKAYIILYDDQMSVEQRRRWNSWEDDMSEWCARDDFRTALPILLEGEDGAFARHIREIAERAGA